MRFFVAALAVLLLSISAPNAALAQGSPTWQQRVHYEMDVHVAADRHQLAGRQRLTYVNNAPDTLTQVFYHLYFNAFEPGSMMAERNRHLPDPDGRIVPRIFELGPEERGYHEVQRLTQNGQPVAFTVDGTVLAVDLAAPIAPGERAVFEMAFRSQVPLQTRRSGRDSREGIDFSMSQWYPKMANYDESGWHPDPYVGREFYAPFGTFDVRLTLPSDYVVGATGVLQNPAEIGHGYAGGGPDAGPASDADSLTWRFVAENVHDFAWVADPDYLHEQFEDELGITYHLYYLPDVAERWRMMRQWVPQIIQFFSKHYGQYAYPQFTVAQAGDGGMEYPMVNFITGRRSPYSLLGVTAHEAAHEWFYGMLGSNEARYAWMDEGFTSYISGEVMAHLTGREADHTGAYLSVLGLHDRGLFERINTPSDFFETNSAYGTAAYSAGEMVAAALGYVISDELRDEWFKEYYRRFRFRHPNPVDVEKVAEDVSGLRLDWFFEQLTNTNRTFDYEVDDLRSVPTPGGWRTTLELEREDEGVMPIDLRLTLADGTEQWVNIPLGLMNGHKPVPPDWIVADPWHWTFPAYELDLTLPARVVAAEIDPRGGMPDRNRLNNATSFPLEFDFLQPPTPDWFTYGVGYRPLVQYANDFGFGVGLRARGAYLFDDYLTRAMVKVWPQVLAGKDLDTFYLNHGGRDEAETSSWDGIDYDLGVEFDAPSFGPLARLDLSARKHLGLMENAVRLTRRLENVTPRGSWARSLSLAAIHQYNPTNRVFLGTMPQIHDRAGDRLVFNPFQREHVVSARLDLDMRRGADRRYLGAEWGGSVRPHSPLKAHRIWAGIDEAFPVGSFDGLIRVKVGLASESLVRSKGFLLGAPSIEDQWRHAATRTALAAFEDPVEDAHLVAFGEPGPVAYLPAALPTANVSALSIRLGKHPAPRSRWLAPLAVHGFFGAGHTARNMDLDDVRYDAGFGLDYDVSAFAPLKRWTAQSDVLQGLHLSARFPIWASDGEVLGEDDVAFRWMLGVTIDH